MKTMKFKLFATMITLAAVAYISILPANAQRRTSEKEKSNSETRSTSDRRKAVEQKSTFKTDAKVERSRVNREMQPQKNNTTRENTVRTNSGASRQSAFQVEPKHNSGEIRQVQTNNKTTNRSDNETRNASVFGNENKRNSQSEVNSYNGVPNQNREISPREYPSARVNTSTAEGRRNTGFSASNNRDFYRTEKDDRRYEPAKDFRGSNEYWSDRNRPNNMNYNKTDRDFYSNKKYNSHENWDRNWEHYRWNYNSWRDYYRGYNPQAFVYYKHYYHHPYYGHVIRRFDFRPLVFVHNHHKYYCYDGHFFRYRSGVGYILVDLPYEFTFEWLPAEYYERVYVNGYLYFRVGNLFFESTAYGFSLVHFPDRYYAWDNTYERQGYIFDDMYW